MASCRKTEELVMASNIVYNLCAAEWTNYILDIIVVLLMVGFAVVCAKRGFIECFFSFVSTIGAVIIALTCAKLFMNLTGGLFGLRGLFEDKFTDTFSKLNGFDVDISSQGIKAAIEGKNLPAVLGKLIVNTFGKEELAVGTTLGMLLGVSTAKLAATLLSGIVLFIVIKILFRLLKTIITTIVESVFFLDRLDGILGALVGLIEALLIVSLVLSVLTIIPSQAVSSYLDRSLFIGWLYNNNPLVTILGWFL